MTTTETEPVHSHQKIASEIQSWIGGDLRVGDLLPSERVLAARFSVQRATIRRAFDVMARQGHIRRQPNRGAVVVDRHATGEFAIVIDPSLLRPNASPFYPLAATAIGEALGARNSRWGAKVHIGRACQSIDEHVASLDLLEPDVLKRLRGVFTFHPLDRLEAPLKAARIPVVNMWSVVCSESPEYAVEGNTVVFDYLSFYDQAFAHLKASGCRTVGVLAFFYGPHFDREMAALTKCADAHGLRIRPDWLRTRVEWDEKREAREPMVYEAFYRLGKSTSCPDGLLVTDDVACRGVLRASLRLGVEFPEHLRLVTHANHGAPFAYHKEVTRVEFDPAAQARAAVELMLRLLRDPDATEPVVYVPVTLIKGETT
ncbi:MAG: substrate-binding domain-containing protein [Kiritimatiellae bacterium]|nr:substrate-binding domain-containing protein [Kiritimatiellia bacterium]